MPDRVDFFRHVGFRVRQLRQAREWSLLALATDAKISPRFLTEVEAGRANPSLRRLLALAAALEVELSDLFPERALRGGPRAAIDRLLDARDYDELHAIRRELQLRYGRKQRQVIALLGVRGAGKSRLGSELARVLQLEFLELDDAVVERSGLSLSALFALHGESYYRQVEPQCLVEVFAREKPLVLATGGGIVEHLESYDLLLRHTVTVWLDARADRLWERVVGQGDERPMRGRATALAQLNLLLERRRPLYSRALLHVETSDTEPARLTGDLVEQLQLLKADLGQSAVGENASL